MSTIVVVGGQYGSEGKGKVCAHLGATENAHIMVRCGGPNSGHTVADENGTFILKQLPAGAPHLQCRLLIPAGAYVVPSLLFHEMEMLNIDPARIGIDKNCAVIRDNHLTTEKKSDLQKRIGSTQSGTGAAVKGRIDRLSPMILAAHESSLKPFITDVAGEIASANKKGLLTIIEGTQGFGLSLYHSPHYPFATSRDTTAAGFASEVGISPLDIDEVVMVIRAFPIRVAGNSGPLPNECDWETVTKLSHAPQPIEEFTSVTKRLRRIAKFDPEIVSRAILLNNPSKIVLNHADYINWEASGITELFKLPKDVIGFVEKTEGQIEHHISLIGTGPKNRDMVISTTNNLYRLVAQI